MIESDFLHVDEKLGHSIQKEKAPNQYPKCRENLKKQQKRLEGESFYAFK